MTQATDGTLTVNDVTFKVHTFLSSDSFVVTQGGRCLSIFKSLSGSDAFMNNFYTPGQNFVVDGQNYYPVLSPGSDSLYRDIFLIGRY